MFHSSVETKTKFNEYFFAGNWNTVARSTFRLVGTVWTDSKEIDWNGENIYSDNSEKTS